MNSAPLGSADSTIAGAPPPGLVTYVHLIYGLHAFAVLTGVLTSSTIAGRFLFGLPSIIAVILNYARRNEARGTWLESHFAWQIRTFWFALLWIVVTLLISAPLTLIVVGIFFAIAGFALVGLWVAYRVVRGWLALRAHHAMPRPALAGPTVNP
jgi:uncharacterized membrane protein